MSYSRGTPNFNLPQTQGSDKRDWADTNAAFLAVDTALKAATDAAAAAGSAASTAQSTANNAATAASNAQSTANGAVSSATAAAELASTAKNRADNAYTLANNANNTANTANSTANAAKTEVDKVGSATLGTFSPSYATLQGQVRTTMCTLTLNKGRYIVYTTGDSNTLDGNWHLFINGIDSGSIHNSTSYDNTLNAFRVIDVDSNNTSVPIEIWTEGNISAKLLECAAIYISDIS